MEPHEENMTYYMQAEKQWENDQRQTHEKGYRQSLFEGSPDLSIADKNQEAFEEARQGQGPLTPQSFEPLIFHPSEAEKVVAVYTIESGKAPKTYPPSWAHEHGTFDQPLDIERVEFISRDGKKFWLT
jgi:hypothetical protein